MNWRKQWPWLIIITGVFLLFYWLPVKEPGADASRLTRSLFESLLLAKWYAREHVLLCLIPAFFIAGAIGVFVSQTSVMRYLGARANKTVAYGVASVSGSVLAVCSCTVLPLFAGIYRMGAGLGPATAFLYSGPAINVLAIILTARVLGLELGIARAVGAIVFSIIIGLLMHLIYRKEEVRKAATQVAVPEPPPTRALWKNGILFAAMIGILIFVNWARSGDVRAVFLCCPGGLMSFEVQGRIVEETEASVKIVDDTGREHDIPKNQIQELTPGNFQETVYGFRWWIAGALALGFVLMVWRWVTRSEAGAWVESSWGFAKQILPLLLIGVLIAGALLGRPDHEGLIPSAWVAWAVGGNSFFANLFAALVGAFMYFATLTEIPILKGLIDAGMGKGPALALLLAGPALSLPNMLVIRSVMGTKKTLVYIVLVVVMATISGIVFGSVWG